MCIAPVFATTRKCESLCLVSYSRLEWSSETAKSHQER